LPIFDAYHYFVLMAGRGFGKTRIGAEETFWDAFSHDNQRCAVVSPTASDLRRVCFEGESGLLSVIPKECYKGGSIEKGYNRSNQEIILWNNSLISGFSAEKSARLRGPQFHFAWMDELAAWKDGHELGIRAVYDMLLFCVRLGSTPRLLVTTTPKPLPVIRDLKLLALKFPDKNIFVTGSTYENEANLSPAFKDQIVQYEGTALGRQEIHAEILDLSDAGIFKKSWFKKWPKDKAFPRFSYIIQSYDTAFTEKTTSDPTACTVWGVFKDKDNEGKPAVMLIDCWTEKLIFSNLRKKVEEDYENIYGDSDKEVDAVLIEEKGSGISLIQVLRVESEVPVFSFNPGSADKIARAHATSHFPFHGMVYIPESKKNPGSFIGWALPFIDQMCMFPNDVHDDMVDTYSQAMIWLSKAGLLGLKVMFQNPEEDKQDPEERFNPYSQ
jgi:predicted phage terminase large subunit-like protein